MRNFPIPSLWIETEAINREAARHETVAWGNWHIQLDLSFTKRQSQQAANQILNTFLRKMAQYQRLHLDWITYEGGQKNNNGSWHFHIYIRVKEGVSRNRLQSLVRAMGYEWREMNGLRENGRNNGQPHKCFHGCLMDERLANYKAYNSTEVCKDATGFTYRVKGHSTEKAVPRTVCPRRKRQCRRGNCEYQHGIGGGYNKEI